MGTSLFEEEKGLTSLKGLIYMMSKQSFKADLESLFQGFRWTFKGFIDEDEKIHELPDIPQVITGIFQEVAKQKLKPFLREQYGCEIIQGGAREYP